MSNNHIEDKLTYANDAQVTLDEASLARHCATPRSGLPNSAAKFLKEKTGGVAFLGGSITRMDGWRNMVEDDLRVRFPETGFQFINAGVGGTNSTFGAFRFDEHVLAPGQQAAGPAFSILPSLLSPGVSCARRGSFPRLTHRPGASVGAAKSPKHRPCRACQAVHGVRMIFCIIHSNPLRSPSVKGAMLLTVCTQFQTDAL